MKPINSKLPFHESKIAQNPLKITGNDTATVCDKILYIYHFKSVITH